MSDNPFMKFWVLRLYKFPEMGKIRVLEEAEIMISTILSRILYYIPKTRYNASMVAYITSLCYLGYVSLPIYEILGLKVVKISQNGKN